MTRDEARLIAEEFARAMGRDDSPEPKPTPTGMTPEQQEKYKAAQDRIIEGEKQRRMIAEKKLEIIQKTHELEQAIRENRESDAKQLENEIIKLKKRKELIEGGAEASKSLADSFASIFSGKAPDLKGALDPKNIKDLATNFQKVKAAKMASATASKAGVGAAIALTKAIVELALELDEAEVGFMKTTGANRDFARSITESYRSVFDIHRFYNGNG
jgi:DNA-binding protein H-NS